MKAKTKKLWVRAGAIIGVIAALITIYEFFCKNVLPTEDIKRLKVDISVHAQAATSNEVFGYPVMFDVNVQGEIQPKGLYVHLFQREAGGQNYYYQDSSKIVFNTPAKMKVWLGRESDSDKAYEVYAVINDSPMYKKHDGVCSVEVLPDVVVAKKEVYRKK